MMKRHHGYPLSAALFFLAFVLAASIILSLGV